MRRAEREPLYVLQSAFRISSNAATGRTNTVAVAPMGDGVTPESAWVRLTPPEPDARPCGWSPSGELLYFVSGRDGTRCLYAQRVHRQTGQPAGLPFAVQHFHGSRNLSGGQQAVLSTAPANAIHAGLFFYDLGERQSNIWLLSPAPRVK